MASKEKHSAQYYDDIEIFYYQIIEILYQQQSFINPKRGYFLINFKVI